MEPDKASPGGGHARKTRSSIKKTNGSQEHAEQTLVTRKGRQMSDIMDKVRDLLVDVDYPASKDELVREAQTHGGTEADIKALRAMPPVDYRNTDEVLRSIDVHPADLTEGHNDAGDGPRTHTQPERAQHMTETDVSVAEAEARRRWSL